MPKFREKLDLWKAIFIAPW